MPATRQRHHNLVSTAPLTVRTPCIHGTTRFTTHTNTRKTTTGHTQLAAAARQRQPGIQHMEPSCTATRQNVYGHRTPPPFVPSHSFPTTFTFQHAQLHVRQLNRRTHGILASDEKSKIPKTLRKPLCQRSWATRSRHARSSHRHKLNFLHRQSERACRPLARRYVRARRCQLHTQKIKSLPHTPYGRRRLHQLSLGLWHPHCRSLQRQIYIKQRHVDPKHQIYDD